MKQKHMILSAAIAAALAATPAILLAGTASGSVGLGGVNAGEASRITQTVNNTDRVTIPKTHLNFVAGSAFSSAPLPDSTVMNHLQMVLKPSAMRQAALESLIVNQHNPKSAQFDQWVTPQQFGENFGVTDADIAAVTAWLKSQGFTVNNVYPNKTQIDFSGTAGQVRQAFHTQETVYTIGKSQSVASAGDISVPAALRSVVAGVAGLNNPVATAHSAKTQKIRAGAEASPALSLPSAVATRASKGGISQAITTTGNIRGLVPNDMVTMYGIRTLRNNGVTGKGINIAIVANEDVVPAQWNNFVSVFNLAQYGGTLQVTHPAPVSGANNCGDPAAVNFYYESGSAVSDAEWATATAPGANITVASCANPAGFYIPNQFLPNPADTNASQVIGGVFIAASNLVNGPTRPDIMSVGFNMSEYFFDSPTKAQIDELWEQADAEGISVYVSAGNASTDADQFDFFADDALGAPGLNVNGIGSSAHVTVVGGTDLADVLDGTTSKYFAPSPSAVGGSALSYVPEIPWNASCGNGVAAKAFGYGSAVAFCKEILQYDIHGNDITAIGTSGGASAVDAKPTWQQLVYNAPKDHSRDLPDVALYGGSWGQHTAAVVCITSYPCAPDFSSPQSLDLFEGTAISTAMFSGIQALIDQGLHARGLPVDQGNAAPTLYALAANEYGGPSGAPPSSLAACNADNGATGTASCLFHNVTRGSISANCFESPTGPQPTTTTNCYYYGSVGYFYNLGESAQLGLATTDVSPTAYSTSNKAYGAQSGWSFASGLGSVNATNLLIAWRAFVNAPPASTAAK